jgi:outer membrane immunogenic protein
MEMALRSIGYWATLTLVLGGVHLAAAADLPPAGQVYKAPPAVAAYNWTGFYVGGNIGYSWGKIATDSTDGIATSFVGVPFNVGFAHSNASTRDGIAGGGQIGYNWQVSPNWVYGLEADWQAASEKARLSYSDPYLFIGSGALSTNYEAKALWFGTVRGRVGYAWDRLLIYATGGLAYGEVKLNGTMNDSGLGLFAEPYSATTPFSRSKDDAGWTAGAGLEGAIASNWTWKIEYLYLDLGSLNFSGPGPFSSETITAHARFNDNIVRAGLNFQFH